MSDTWQPQFLYVTCQQGAEPALKAELAVELPEARLAYSRPGFVTFKLEKPIEKPKQFRLRATFARSYGFSLGKVSGEQPWRAGRASLAVASARVFSNRFPASRFARLATRHSHARPTGLRAGADGFVRRNRAAIAPAMAVNTNSVAPRIARFAKPTQRLGAGRGAGRTQPMVDRLSPNPKPPGLLARRCAAAQLARKRLQSGVSQNGRGDDLVGASDRQGRSLRRARLCSRRRRTSFVGARLAGNRHRSGRSRPGGARSSPVRARPSTQPRCAAQNSARPAVGNGRHECGSQLHARRRGAHRRTRLCARVAADAQVHRLAIRRAGARVRRARAKLGFSICAYPAVGNQPTRDLLGSTTKPGAATHPKAFATSAADVAVHFAHARFSRVFQSDLAPIWITSTQNKGPTHLSTSNKSP